MADFHYNSNLDQIIYVQKIFFVTTLVLLTQVPLGHRLPIVAGPATVLLVGEAASMGSDSHTVYSSIMIGRYNSFLNCRYRTFRPLKKIIHTLGGNRNPNTTDRLYASTGHNKSY